MIPKIEKKIVALQKKMSKKYPDVDIVYLYDDTKKVYAVAFNPDSGEWFNLKNMKPLDTSVTYFGVDDEPFDFESASSGGAISIEVMEKDSNKVVTIAFDPASKSFFDPQTGEPIDVSKYVDGEGKAISADMFLSPEERQANAEAQAEAQKAEEQKPQGEVLEAVDPAEVEREYGNDLLSIQDQHGHDQMMHEQQFDYSQDPQMDPSGMYDQNNMYQENPYGYDQQQQYVDNYQDMYDVNNQQMYDQNSQGMYDMNGQMYYPNSQDMFGMNDMTNQMYDPSLQMQQGEGLEAFEKDDESVVNEVISPDVLSSKQTPATIIDDATSEPSSVNFKVETNKKTASTRDNERRKVVEDIYSYSTFNSNIDGLKSVYVVNAKEEAQEAQATKAAKSDVAMFSIEDESRSVNFDIEQKEVQTTSACELAQQKTVQTKCCHHDAKQLDKPNVKSMVDEIEEQTDSRLYHDGRYPLSRRRQSEIYASDSYEARQRRRVPYDYIEEEIFIRPDVSETSEIRNIRSSVLRNPRPIPNAYYYDDVPEFADYNYRPAVAPYPQVPVVPPSFYRPRRAAVLLPSADRIPNNTNALIGSRNSLKQRQQFERRARFEEGQRDDINEVFGYKGPFSVPSEYYYRRFSHHYPLNYQGLASPVATYYDPVYYSYRDVVEPVIPVSGYYPSSRTQLNDPYARAPISYYKYPNYYK